MAFRPAGGFDLSDDERASLRADAGQAEGIKDESGGSDDLVLVFRTMRDTRVRPEHAALEGRTWELDDADAPAPPLAPNCRCEVVIVPRDKARPARDEAASLRRFKDLEANLARVYPQEVIDGFAAGHLTPDDIILTSGDRITSDQAIAIVRSRQIGRDETKALTAVARLQSRGISGRVLRGLEADAERLIAERGLAPDVACREAVMATPARGTAPRAASAKVGADLLSARDVPPIPRPKQVPQLQREGRRLEKSTGPARKVPAPGNGVSSDLMRSIELRIAGRTTERSVTLLPGGERLGSLEGDATSCDVVFTRGCIITHNHPDIEGQRPLLDSLSDDDMENVRVGAAEIRAVTPSGWVFSASPGPKMPQDKEAFRETLLAAQKKAIDRGLASKDDHGAVIRHHALRLLSRAKVISYRWGRWNA